MRTLILIVLLAIVPFMQQVWAQGNVKQEIVLSAVENDDDRDVKGTLRNPGEPVAMSLLPPSPYAYLYNNKVYVSFEGFAQTVHIRVVDNSTEEVVHQQTYAAPSEAVIHIEEKGDYTLKIEVDGMVWEGWFVY